ncbi:MULTISPECIES: flagellar basal body-associated FliL family protein [unclassified Variovorax]|uniref:flagellar basal body-associated FliL family protein n=1 Tax=unclassified Variovorax TaxID=663243 RepID=UPI00257507E1|nr:MULTISPECIES: flagellar basal body-associated FliL family protein [unclassified Variovorax]MDM0089794.1 flagellar basal body-associated FliL family protein [Variovorax sp. J22G40]MDM0148540.1 flagellar basal body-associated FliL family protein [Variovorax sp. J2P1-31]
MSAKAADSAPATDKPKGKLKPLLLGLAGVLLLVSGAGGTWFFLNNKKAHAPAHEEEAVAETPKAATPSYLALDNMVFNLADGGGDRVAQVGITLELQNDKAAEQIKQLMPKIRNGVLLMVSQRTSEELLKRDGKEKLAGDIQVEVSRLLGYDIESPKPAKGDEDAPVRRKKSAQGPVQAVLFSSFIVQ